MQYKFVVDEPQKVDLNRIIRENPGQEAILVTGEGDQALLLLSEDFLNNFRPSDQIRVDDELLDISWGWTKWQVEQMAPGRVAFSRYGYHGEKQSVEGYRARCVSVTDIAAIKQQLAAARAYQRQLVIKIHYL